MSKYRIRPYYNDRNVSGFIVQRRWFLIWWSDIIYFRRLAEAEVRLAELKRMEAIK